MAGELIGLKAIVPKGALTKISQDKIMQQVKDWQKATVARVSKYPPQRQPSTYRRTGEYGRRWTFPTPAMQGRDLIAEVGTNLEYASYVGGYTTQDPRQTRVAEAVGWESVETVGTQEWAKRRPMIDAAIQGK